MAERQRVLLLTGASRGIGHATVKTFSDAGWRVLTISRHPFDPRCPWDGAKNHIQLDLADIGRVRGRDAAAARHRRRRAGRADQQRRGLAEAAGRREDRRAGDGARRLAAHLQREPVRLRGAGPGPARPAGGGARDGGEHDLHRRLAGASVRVGGLCRLEGGAMGADPRVGGGFRTRRRAGERGVAGRDRHRHPVARDRGHRRAGHPACAGWASPRTWPTCCCSCARTRAAIFPGRKSTSTAANGYKQNWETPRCSGDQARTS